MVKLEFKTQLSSYDITAVFVALIYSLITVQLSLTKLHSFRYSSLDLGIFTQSLAGFFHGKPLFNTVEWQIHGAPNHFGVHFQPILLLLVPVFRVFPSPKTLLVLQSLALGSSVFLAYILAKKVLDERLGVVLTVLYALNSSLVGINLFEFHPVSLAVPLFILAVYLLIDGNILAFYATSVLLLLTKEDAFLGVTSLALWWALRDGLTPDSPKRNRNFLIHAGLTIVYGIIVIRIVIPHFGNGYIYGSLYSHPSLGSKKALYFFLFNLTFGLMPLFRPRNALLLTLPWLENLLASRPSQTAFGFHYPYMLVPLSFIATVFTLKELNLQKAITVLLILGIIASFSTMPVAEKPPRIHNPMIHY